MKEYDLKFLTFQRQNQYKLVNYLLDNNIKYWDMINKNKFLLYSTVNNLNLIEFKNFLTLPQFSNWLVGFSEASASFGIKKIIVLFIILDKLELKI